MWLFILSDQSGLGSLCTSSSFIRHLHCPFPEDGPKTFRADGIGDCFFAAIDDFTSQNPMSSVTDVRLVVPDSSAGCIPAIISALQARTTALTFQWGIGKIFKSQLGFLGSNKFTECTVTIYSDTTINKDRCINALDDRTSLEFAEKVVDVDMDVISKLKDKQINRIIDSDIAVDVKFDKSTGKFNITGPLLNVLAAVTCLHNTMQQYKRKENNRKSAKALYDQTRWHWLYQNHVASEEVPYDMMTNFIIETAYRDMKQTLELQSKDGKIYVIDFEKLVEYHNVNINDIVMLIRKDILKLKDDKISVKDKLVMKFRSFIGGSAYQEVKKRFFEEVKNGLYANKLKNSQSVEVVKIERIQNKTLSKQYQAKKKLMEQQKPGCKQIERSLWHETAVESIPRIINNGFNRSNFRVHGVLYGEGVYFAADASYSAKSYLDEIKPGTKRHMFLAKVLTGEIVNGNPSMRVLPPIDPVYPSIMYDSAVDDINNPTDFVIFHENQAYPEYLITYTSK